MRGIWGIDPAWALTAIRIPMALILIQAGVQKFAGGIGGVVAGFAKMGIPAPEIAAPFVMVLELVGGVLLLLGLGSRWLGLLFAIQFAVATFYVKMPSAGWGGARLDLLLAVSGLAFLLGGAGRAALDNLRVKRERVQPPRSLRRAA